MSRDQRRHRRYDVDGVRGSLLFSLDARILNMSLTGMAIETSSLLHMGSSYSLRVAHAGGQLRFKTYVKWCHLERNERTPEGDSHPVYQAGLDFREILDESALQVLAFLEEHIIVELDRRLGGRFHLASQPPAALVERHDFEVRRLSLGGLLVETEWEPSLEAEVELEISTGRTTLHSRGRVRSVLPSIGDPDGGPLYAVGLELTGVAPDDRRALAALVENLLE
jgi:hypothetical protein